MKHEQVITDDALIQSYMRTGSVWRTGEEIGMCGQSVHERLSRIGAIKRMNYWTKEDDKILLAKYKSYKRENRLNELALELGRTKQFICRKARVLGLTNSKDLVISDSTKSKLRSSTKEWIASKGHPKGYLGHRHSAETRQKISIAVKRGLSKPECATHTEEYKQRLSDNLHEMRINNRIDVYSNRGKHKITIDGIAYIFKSSWEVQIAKKLQDLVDDGFIKHWKYEAKHFIFNDVKRGNRSYCPDFEVTLNNGDLLYIEVKGWKMQKSLERIDMFRERYPDVKLYMIDSSEYGKILSESDYLRRCCIEV